MITSSTFTTNRRKTGVRLSLLAIFAAALMPATTALAATTHTAAAPDLTVQIVDGRNCLNGRCVTLNTERRSVKLPGRNAVMVPRDIDLSHGYVSKSDYRRIFDAAFRANAEGSQRR